MAINYTDKQIDKVGEVTFAVSSKINGKIPKKINGVSRSFKFVFNKFSSSSKEDACNQPIPTQINRYSWDSTLSTESTFCSDVNVSTSPSNGYYVNSEDDVVYCLAGTVANISECTSSHSHLLYYSNKNCSSACAGEPDTTYYSEDEELNAGSYLYVNESLTEPAANGYYSDNRSCFTVDEGRILTKKRC